MNPSPESAPRRKGGCSAVRDEGLETTPSGRVCLGQPAASAEASSLLSKRRTDRLRSAAPGLLFGGGLSDLTFVVLPVSAPRCTLKPSTGRRAPWAS